MSTHKNIDRICIVAIIIAVVLSVLMMNGEALGITRNVSAMGYEKRLFDTSTVHTIDIVMEDWDSFIQTAQSEEYSACAVIIDGKAYKNVGIRGKGNTSLSSVASMDSERYSFKIEFDKYDKNKSYYGLDKLCLNNIIQDNTYIKDYLAYQMMNEFGVDAPLCSFAYIAVNGEDWGLYLAVEGVEDGFLQRNYGTSYGNLYKPDSMSMGGGRGNGKEFDFSEMEDKFSEMFGDADFDEIKQQADKFMNRNNGDENTDEPQGGFTPDNQSNRDSIMQNPDGMSFPNADNGFNPENSRNENSDDNSVAMDFSYKKDGFEMPDMGNKGNMGGFGGGMGSDDVKLQYIDDNFDSYSNIFESAKTDISDSDKERLISSLKSLSENTDIEDVVDVEKVIRYFVVHNFVCNGDSYTGSMIHNYYLYEKDGKMSMIPWDYNLAYGTFQGGNAQSEVNSPIDTPVSGDMSDRPMINWIFENEEYTELYHQCFAEFLNGVDIEAVIDEAAELIAPYVEKDPTKFCTYEEFEKGVETLRTFCKLRSESVQGQLDGTIPSTTDGQSADSSSLVDASSITLSDMGTMNNGGDRGGDKGGFGGGRHNNIGANDADNTENRNNDRNTENSDKSAFDNQSVQQNDTVKMTYSVSANSDTHQAAQIPTNAPDFGNGTPPDDMPQPPDNAAGQTPPDFANRNDSENNFSADADNSDEQNSSENSADSDNPKQSDSSDNFAPPSMNNAKGENGNKGSNQFNGTPDSDNRQVPQNSGSQNSVNAYILLAVSVVLLVGGLAFAFKFRR